MKYKLRNAVFFFIYLVLLFSFLFTVLQQKNIRQLSLQSSRDGSVRVVKTENDHKAIFNIVWMKMILKSIHSYQLDTIDTIDVGNLRAITVKDWEAITTWEQFKNYGNGDSRGKAKDNFVNLINKYISYDSNANIAFAIQIAILSDTKKKLNTRFIEVKPALQKINTYQLSVVDGISTVELKKISDWSSVLNLDAFIKDYGLAYNELDRLVKRYISSANRVQEITNKIEDAVDAKLKLIFNQTRTTLAKINTYWLDIVNLVGVNNLKNISVLATLDYAVFKNNDPAFNEFSTLVLKYINEEKPAQTIIEQINTAVNTKLMMIFNQTKDSLVKIQTYQLNTLNDVSVNEIRELNILIDLDYINFKKNHHSAYNQFYALVKKHITKSNPGPTIISKINTAINNKLKKIFTQTQVFLQMIFGFQLDTVDNERVNNLKNISDLITLDYAVFKNNALAFSEFDALVKKNIAVAYVTSIKNINDKLFISINSKLSSIFTATKDFLAKIHTYQLERIQIGVIINFKAITSDVWKSLDHKKFKDNHVLAYWDFVNLVRKYIAEKHNPAAKIIAEIEKAMDTKLNVIFTAAKDALTKIYTYQLERIQIGVIMNFKAITSGVWKNLVWKKFKDNHKLAYQDFVNLVRKYITEKHNPAAKIIAEIEKAIDTKLNVIFTATKDTLKKIKEYQITRVGHSPMNKVLTINLKTIIPAVWNAVTWAKFQQEHHAASAEFYTLVKKYITQVNPAQMIIAKINEEVELQVKSVFEKPGFFKILKKIKQRKISKIGQAPVAELSKFDWDKTKTWNDFQKLPVKSKSQLRNLIRTNIDQGSFNVNSIIKNIDSKLPKPEETSKGSSFANKISLSLSLGLGLPVFLALVIAVLIYRQKKTKTVK